MRQVQTWWLVTGELRRRVDNDRPRWDRRVVLMESNDFPSYAEAQEALLTNWSNRPHEVRVLAIQAFVPDNSVIVRER